MFTACTCANNQALRGWRRWESELIPARGGMWPAAWTPLGDHADVALCTVGYGAKALKRYGKALRFQIKGCAPLLSVLRMLKCRCTVAHDGRCTGKALKQTAFYSKTLAYYLVIGARCT